MGNEISDMAADAVIEATVDGGGDIEADVNVDFGGAEGAVEELQRTFATIDLDEEGADDYSYDDGDYVEEEDAYGEDQEYDYEEDYDEVGEEDYDEVEEGDEEAGGYAYDLGDLGDVEIGETEEGLLDEDISLLREECAFDFSGIDPMEPIDWDCDEFYSYDYDELATATDIELTSVGYPPEPIGGATTEDIMFSVDMMEASTVPPATYTPEMVSAAQRMADTTAEMADSIRETRESLA